MATHASVRNRRVSGTKRPPELADLSRRRRHLLLLSALLRPVLTATALVVAYYVLPMDQPFSARTVITLSIGLLAVSGLVAWQTRTITRSPYPRLKGIEALATIFPLFLLLFAAAYFLMARSQSDFFSESLTRTDALYFTVTVFSTVGFGDITPTSQGARCAVMVQMFAGMVMLGVAVRVIVGAVGVGLGKRGDPPTGGHRPARLRHAPRRRNRSVRSSVRQR